MTKYKIITIEGVIESPNLDAIKGFCLQFDLPFSEIETYEDNTTYAPFTEPKIARIKALQIEPNKDHRAVDWNTELLVTLASEYEYGKTVMDRGLLKSKTYFHKNDKILKITYDYVMNSIGNIEQQEINIAWYNEDDTINENKKEKGFVVFSQDESKKASYKRREAIISMLETDIENMVKGGSSTRQEMVVGIEMAKQLLSDVSTEVSIFKTSSDTMPLINKLENLTYAYPILNGSVAPNVTVLMYISDFLTY